MSFSKSIKPLLALYWEPIVVIPQLVLSTPKRLSKSMVGAKVCFWVLNDCHDVTLGEEAGTTRYRAQKGLKKTNAAIKNKETRGLTLLYFS